MDWYLHQVEEAFHLQEWDQVYSLVEFVHEELNPHEAELIARELNKVFFEEGAPYRVEDGQVVQLMTEAESDEVSKASDKTTSGQHIRKATNLLNKRPEPDYENSIKESILAVEAISKEITNDSSATLSKAIKKIDLHPALQTGTEKLYAWTNDEGGLRHALKEMASSSLEAEARYSLVICSAIVNFLREKYID